MDINLIVNHTKINSLNIDNFCVNRIPVLSTTIFRSIKIFFFSLNNIEWKITLIRKKKRKKSKKLLPSHQRKLQKRSEKYFRNLSKEEKILKKSKLC